MDKKKEETKQRRSVRFEPLRPDEQLDFGTRADYRRTLKYLTNLRDALENGEILAGHQEQIVRRYTDSDAPDTRLNAMWDVLDETQLTYHKKLARVAPFDLTAYHEFMNPHEPPAHHHIWLCERLARVSTGQTKTLLLSMPAGAAKSTYASRSFAQWMIGKYPNRNILAVGNQQKFVEFEFSKRNRDAVASEKYQMVFKDVTVDPLARAGISWSLVNPDQDGKPWRGTYYARGAGADVLGIRANMVLGDDLFGQAQDALSQIIRAGVWRWWTADVGSRMLPECATILVNTRYHSEDPIGMIERIYNDPETREAIAGPVEIVNIPAQAEENDPLGREAGEWLWCRDEQPDGYYPISHYIQKRATMPASLWSAVYLGKPLDQFGDFIAEDKFQRYVRYPRNREGLPIEWSKTVMSVDCAAKANERADNTAICIFRLGVDGTHYLVDCWAGRETLEQIVTRMNRMMRFWECSFAIVEDSGMGTQLLENYQGKMERPLKKYTPSGKGSKEFRFDASTPWITSGRVKFPNNSVSWVVPFISELIAFPNGTYDDRVDAFSQYFDSEFKNRKGGTKPLRSRGY